MTTASTVNALQSVSVIVFPEGFNWPMDKGYFARGGIEVVLTPTPNSVFQLTNLNDGKFDIAMTAIDNVIAYMEGQGEAPTVSGSEPECVISDPEKKFSLINEEPFILTMVEVQRKRAGGCNPSRHDNERRCNGANATPEDRARRRRRS